jgi:hypothetical protein
MTIFINHSLYVGYSLSFQYRTKLLQICCFNAQLLMFDKSTLFREPFFLGVKFLRVGSF